MNPRRRSCNFSLFLVLGQRRYTASNPLRVFIGGDSFDPPPRGGDSRKHLFNNFFMREVATLILLVWGCYCRSSGNGLKKGWAKGELMELSVLICKKREERRLHESGWGRKWIKMWGNISPNKPFPFQIFFKSNGEDCSKERILLLQ